MDRYASRYSFSLFVIPQNSCMSSACLLCGCVMLSVSKHTNRRNASHTTCSSRSGIVGEFCRHGNSSMHILSASSISSQAFPYRCGFTLQSNVLWIQKLFYNFTAPLFYCFNHDIYIYSNKHVLHILEFSF